MTTRIVVETPYINTEKSFYPPRNKVEWKKLVEKARIGNLHETSKTQCREFRNQPQVGTRSK